VSSLSLGGLTNDVDADLEGFATGWTEITESFPDLSPIVASVHSSRSPSPLVNWQPPVLPPTRADAADAPFSFQFLQPPPVVYSVPTQTEPVGAAERSPTTVDVGVGARALPRPPLAPPPIRMSDLVRVVGDGLHVHSSASPEFLTDAAIRNLGVRLEHNQHSAVQLAVTFGVELLRHVSEQLLSDMSAHFGHLDHVQHADLVAFLVDRVSLHLRRPASASMDYEDDPSD